MCPGIYELFHDFATPLATALGAGGAVFVTWRIGRGQLSIARQQAASGDLQAQIARDRLRFDQFDKRFEVFDALRQLIRTVVNDSAKPDFSVHVVMPFYSRLHEAPLFFSPNTCKLIDEIIDDCKNLTVMNASNLPPPYEYRTSPKYQLMEKLIKILDSLPQQFVPELGLTHLNTPDAT